MPIIKNPRHERFAQELAAGKTQAEAYIAAGFSANGARGAASKLQANASAGIAARVNELLALRQSVETKAIDRAIERTSITKERVMRELEKLGFANMMDYMRVGHDGD